jgi:hypothetical protein
MNKEILNTYARMYNEIHNVNAKTLIFRQIRFEVRLTNSLARATTLDRLLLRAQAMAELDMIYAELGKLAFELTQPELVIMTVGMRKVYDLMGTP